MELNRKIDGNKQYKSAFYLFAEYKNRILFVDEYTYFIISIDKITLPRLCNILSIKVTLIGF